MIIGIAAHTNSARTHSSEMTFSNGCAVKDLGLSDFLPGEFAKSIADVDAVFFHHSCYNFDELVAIALRQRKHVLMDCASMTDGFTMRKICKLAEEAGVIFQVRNSRIESPLWQATLTELKNPGFIECRRTNLYANTDAESLLRELVPDILLMLSAVRSNVKRVAASQVSHPSGRSAVINVRLEFDNGTTASLIHSSLPVQKNACVSIVQRESFIDIDFDCGQASIAESSHSDNSISSRIISESYDESPQLEAFSKALASRQNTGPDAFDASMALAVGYEILDKLRILSFRGGIAS